MTEAPNAGSPNLTQKVILAPTAFNLNTSNALCLPVFSESQKLIWIYSNKVSLPPDSIAELEKAFSRFPYLTRRKAAKLAQISSLHPDQVKVWFMVQRLRYGISWDKKDIQDMQSKVLSGQRSAKTVSGQSSKEGRDVDKFKGTTSANEDATVEHMVQEKLLTTDERDDKKEDKIYTQMKRRRTLADTQIQTDRRVMQMKRSLTETSQKRGESTLLHATKNELDDKSQAGIFPSSTPPITATPQERQSGIIKMRATFLQCQYPGKEGHNRLMRETGFQRRWIVDWFKDMRYHIKHRKPRWMSGEQHSRVLTNIKHKQCKAGRGASKGPNK